MVACQRSPVKNTSIVSLNILIRFPWRQTIRLSHLLSPLTPVSFCSQLSLFFLLESLQNVWWWLWSVDHILAMWNVSFCHQWSVSSIAVLAFNIVVVRLWRGHRYLRYVATFFLDLLYLPWHLHCFFQLIALLLPLRKFLHLLFLLLGWQLLFLTKLLLTWIDHSLLIGLEDLAFLLIRTHVLVFGDPIFCKLSTTRLAFHSSFMINPHSLLWWVIIEMILWTLSREIRHCHAILLVVSIVTKVFSLRVGTDEFLNSFLLGIVFTLRNPFLDGFGWRRFVGLTLILQSSPHRFAWFAYFLMYC